MAPVAAQTIPGRLFHTPEERAQLDRQRHLGLDPAKTRQDGSLRFDGLVRRSDGRTRVWVNGQELDATGRKRVVTGDGRLVVHSDGHDTSLRVGETLSGIDTGADGAADASTEHGAPKSR